MKIPGRIPTTSKVSPFSLVDRVKGMPECFEDFPFSLASDYPELLSIWLRSCPFCKDESGLSKTLLTVMRCGRAHKVTYRELSEVLAVYLEGAHKCVSA
jgi:hypothetical protein